MIPETILNIEIAITENLLKGELIMFNLKVKKPCYKQLHIEVDFPQNWGGLFPQ